MKLDRWMAGKKRVKSSCRIFGVIAPVAVLSGAENILFGPHTIHCFFALFSQIFTNLNTNTVTHHFNGYFPGKPPLAGYPVDSQSPDVLVVQALTILTIHAIHDMMTQATSLGRAIPQPLINCHPTGF